MNISLYRPQLAEAVGSAVSDYATIKQNQAKMGLLQRETAREDIKMGLLKAANTRAETEFKQEQEKRNYPHYKDELFSSGGLMGGLGETTQNTMWDVARRMKIVETNKETGEEFIPEWKFQLGMEQFKQSSELKKEVAKSVYVDTITAIGQAENELKEAQQSGKIMKPEVLQGMQKKVESLRATLHQTRKQLNAYGVKIEDERKFQTGPGGQVFEATGEPGTQLLPVTPGVTEEAEITGNIVRDKSSPTGYSYVDKQGKIISKGAPMPSVYKPTEGEKEPKYTVQQRIDDARQDYNNKRRSIMDKGNVPFDFLTNMADMSKASAETKKALEENDRAYDSKVEKLTGERPLGTSKAKIEEGAKAKNPVQIRTDFQKDPSMKGNTLSKEWVPYKGYKVYKNGKVMGYYY